MARKRQNLCIFFVIKDPLTQKIKYFTYTFWGNIVAHIHANYQKDWMKTVGAYSIWKRMTGGQTDGRTTYGPTSESSVDYVSNWDKKNLKDYIIYCVHSMPFTMMLYIHIYSNTFSIIDKIVYI